MLNIQKKYILTCTIFSVLQEVVTELLLEYNRKPESVICILIQLCIDVCGFQNFKVADHYNLQDDIAERIIEKMGSDEILVEQEILIVSIFYTLCLEIKLFFFFFF